MTYGEAGRHKYALSTYAGESESDDQLRAYVPSAHF
jgi:hypothetical protein